MSAPMWTDRCPGPVRHRAMPRSVVPVRPRAEWRVWVRCMEGREPAEVLPPRDREDLVWHFVHELGWTDAEVAAHTRMSTYTAARIRGQLELAANRPNCAEASQRAGDH